MSKAKLTVSVIVPVYNEEKVIPGCIESLLRQTHKPDEILVVDNNSKDKTVELLKKYPVTILHEKRRGQAFAQVTGFNAARGDVFVRCDADTRFPDDYIEKLVSFLSKHEDVDAISAPGHFYNLPLAKLQTAFHEIWYYRMFTVILGHPPLLGGNMPFRKAVWDVLKKYPTINNKYAHEDVYLSMLMHRLGFRIVFRKDLWAQTSGRTFMRLKTYIEYPLKTIPTLILGWTKKL